MTLLEVISKAVKNDPDATQFLLSLHQVIDLWDDLIDKDKPVSDADINLAFLNALVALPRNPFYFRYFALLSPLVESAIIDWHTANALEKSKTEPNLREAYVLRCSMQTLTIMAARIVGGMDWAINTSIEMRSLPSEWDAYAAKHGVT